MAAQATAQNFLVYEVDSSIYLWYDKHQKYQGILFMARVPLNTKMHAGCILVSYEPLYQNSRATTMTTIGSNSRTTLEDEIHDVIMSMAKKEKLRKEKLRQSRVKVQENEETPSPRGVADIDVSFKSKEDHQEDTRETVAHQDQRKADIEHEATTFLLQVLDVTVTITQHCSRMRILPGDVRYALELKASKEDEDEEWDSEIEEEEEEMSEEEEEIDEDDEEEDRKEEEEEPTGFSSPLVSIGHLKVKEFKECVLWPHMHMLNFELPIKNAAVQMIMDSLYFFLVQRFS